MNPQIYKMRAAIAAKNNKAKAKDKSKVPLVMPKTLNTYMGAKGYTIPKNELSEEQIQYIKDTLTVSPITPGIMLASTSKFPAYRESTKKIYVPRFFGIEHFGEPKETKIPDGDDISVPFVGTLRDYQVEVVKAYCDATKTSSGGLVNLPCGYGKTTVALNIVSVMRKKTLIIVHKEFLLNQWVERIQQYLPSANVGRIQGQIIDIENKDIVIGMLQSLSMKDYDDSVFSSFGMLLIDEVHHIGSEVFSCALFKIVTKYTLGLSATMDRKDGTTFVFKMFLGDIVYKISEKKQRNVQVRAIQFKSDDRAFNTVEYDFRGNPAYSTMISKLCEHRPRSEFILKVVQDMFIENPAQQIMIIAHNKNVLTYLHDAISERKIATVGYYVGGMKESALKTTEEKQVVIATYAMAAEALDIKTLCTLIMVTPKTDIEQSVGRILRSDHEMPVVVDIVDSHDPFIKQWNKRKTFYKKENYKIIKTCSNAYKPIDDEVIDDKGLMPGWELVYEPKAKKVACVATAEADDNDDLSTTSTSTSSSKCVIDLSLFENA
jgi:superfamily II DNA or RNA helicase